MGTRLSPHLHPTVIYNWDFHVAYCVSGHLCLQKGSGRWPLLASPLYYPPPCHWAVVPAPLACAVTHQWWADQCLLSQNRYCFVLAPQRHLHLWCQQGQGLHLQHWQGHHIWLVPHCGLVHLHLKKFCKTAVWMAICVTENSPCAGLLYSLPRVSSPTTCSAQVEHSVSGDPIWEKAIDARWDWDVTTTRRQCKSWVLLTCWERLQGVKPFSQPGHHTWVGGVSAAFMVGGGNEEGTLEGKKKSLWMNLISQYCNAKIKGDIPLVQTSSPFLSFRVINHSHFSHLLCFNNATMCMPCTAKGHCQYGQVRSNSISG